jgi:hypothetical protein
LDPQQQVGWKKGLYIKEAAKVQRVGTNGFWSVNIRQEQQKNGTIPKTIGYAGLFFS